jgi:hypothetical protein
MLFFSINFYDATFLKSLVTMLVPIKKNYYAILIAFRRRLQAGNEWVGSLKTCKLKFYYYYFIYMVPFVISMM